MELAEYNLRMKDIGAMAKYVRLLNQYSTDSQSELEQTVMSIFNAYYKIHTGALEEADSYLEKYGSSRTS